MPPPAPRLTISQIPKWVEEVYDVKITRQTAYNWTRTGIKGVILHTVPGRPVKNGRRILKLLNPRVTTVQWLCDFIETTGVMKNFPVVRTTPYHRGTDMKQDS